jgi:RHS repeat-associated protein
MAIGQVSFVPRQAFGAETGQPSASDSTTGTPTVVRELTDKRTETSKHYLLSDGSFRAVMSEVPVHFKDDSGKWADIETQLVPGDGMNAYVTKAAPIRGRFGTQLDGQPVRIEGEGYSIGIDMVGVDEGAKLVWGNKARYTNVAQDTSLEYESLDDGVKETLVLGSDKAPSQFSFDMSFTGLEIRSIRPGEWALFRPGDSEPELALGGLCVFDSSVNGAGDPAYCPETTMTVASVPGGARVTYEVSRDWLSDPARKFPVIVDPTITKSVYIDNFVSSAYPGTTYGSSTEIKTGYYDSTTGHNRGLVKFDVLGDPNLAGAYIGSATLSLYQFHTYYVNTPAVTYLGKVIKSWSEASTWNSLGCTVNNEAGLATYLGSQSPSGRNIWVNWSVGPTVQSWVSGAVNYGFMTYQDEGSAAQQPECWRKFYSSEYGTTSLRPKLVVNYSNPTKELSRYVSSYRLGDIMYVQVLVRSYYNSAINDIQLLINYMGNDSTPGGDVSRYRGYVKWSTTNPALSDPSWHSTPFGTSFLSQYFPESGESDYGADHVTLLPGACEYGSNSYGNESSYKRVVFALRIDDAWGDCQQNDLDTHYSLGSWNSGWDWNNTNVNIAAKPVTASCTTTSSAWFTESDPDMDGVPLPNDDPGKGRGSVSLSWPQDPIADGYKVYLHDGNQMRQVGTSVGKTNTSWSSAGRSIFPSGSAIASLPAGYSQSPFVTNGMDLEDDPRDLYRKTAGDEFDQSIAYRLKVVPYDDYAGDVPIADAPTATAGFENRTAGVYSEPRHTEHDLGETLRHQARVLMDKKCLELDIADLTIASWGPEASLTRHYSSSSTETGLFAPGWRFSFEESLEVSSSVIVWTDAAGERRAFRPLGGQWTAPIGCREALSSTGNGWRIGYVGGDHTDFDTTGKLDAKYDANGNKVTYLWGPSTLSIIAANGQLIDIALDGTRPATATYATSDGTRTVTYSAPLAGGDATATLFAGSEDELALAYHYQNGRLVYIIGPDINTLWWNGPSAWDFDLTNQPDSICSFAGFQYPAYDHTFEFASQEATVSEARGSIDGVESCAYADQRFEINPDGTLARSSNMLPGGLYEGLIGEFVYSGEVYDVNGRVMRSVDMSGAVTASEYDDRGNLVKATGPVGDVSTYAYDSLDRCVSETDPLGSTTYRTFDTSGNVTVEEEVLNIAGDRSRTERVYDTGGRGLLATESVKLDSSSWAITDYSDFASNGQPQTTVARGVETESGLFSDLVTARRYDTFGNLLWEKDSSGVYSQRSNTYSVSGLLLSSEADTGTVTHHAYDRLGHETETSTTAGGQVRNWTRLAPDVVGLVTCETRLDAAGGEAHGSTSDLDVQGHVIGGPPPGVSLSATLTTDLRLTRNSFDAAGRVVKSWAPGSWSAGSAYDHPEASTRTTYDIEGRAIAVLAPGADASQATTTTYDLGGRVTRVASPDGTWVEYDHDPAGNVVEERRSGATEPKTNTYDLAGRLISTTNEDGATTTSAYDLSGRPIQAGIGGSGPSSTVYNTAGWVLQRTDSDGIATTYAYDKAGRVVTETIGTDVTVTEYDGSGRTKSVARSDGRSTSFAYDAFGRTIDESQTIAGALVKRTQTSLDEFDRVKGIIETAGGVTRTVGYAEHGSTPVTSTVSYGGLSVESTYAAATGLETSASAIGLNTTIHHAVLSRDEQSRMISASVQVNAGTSRATSWVYDAAGKLSSVDGLGFTSAGADFVYENGRKVQETLALSWPASRTGSYAYTDAGRLSTSTIDGQTTTYSFDAAGNITGTKPSGESTTTLTYSDSRLASMGSTSFGWDAANGRRASMKRSGESSTTYSYTESGALKEFVRPTGDTTLSASYSYDASGQRTQSVERAQTSTSSVETTTSWTYDGLNLLSLTAVRSDGATWSITYVYDERSRPYAGIYSSNESTTSTVFLIVTSDRGDVIELVDSAGTAFATYGYDAWGNPVAASTQSTNTADAPFGVQLALRQPLRYAGYAFDSHSGLYYCSQRYYDPVTMQWMTKDPAKADGEESAYQYCGGNPVGKVDPSGLKLISMSFYPEKKDQWCAPACIQTAAKHATGVYYTQEAIHRYAWGNSYDIGLYGSMTTECLNRYAGGCMLTYFKVKQQFVNNEINANRPLIYSNGPHVRIIYGYSGSTIYMFDPHPVGRGEHISKTWAAVSKEVWRIWYSL